jgi:restriction system protein
MENLPKYQDLISPMLKVMNLAGKPLTNSEIEVRIIQDLQLPPEQVSLIHSGKRTELQYRLAWARTKAKSLGLITSPARETWELTSQGAQTR